MALFELSMLLDVVHSSLSILVTYAPIDGFADWCWSPGVLAFYLIFKLLTCVVI